MQHHMSPTAVAILFLLALVVDWMSVGPNSIRDRVAFFFALAAVREGFNGSPLDRWTVGFLGGIIQQLLDATKGAYIAGAIVSTVIGAAVGILWIYTVGCVLPVKAGKKLGRFATLSFPQSPLYRLNVQMWVIAFLLGMLSDLPHGAIGSMTASSIDLVTSVVAPLPAYLFGSA
ncbi:hypothetical protein Apa02nite_068200 [Actinoplanes palleronii]|uniref:Uncharacterized protein n=1 Tax=Actinoplanes palleronii TaxID=113570 RepID=A0ABQ4BJ66_9ACTN|nr:hypothetical protein Apa02nite_068200 [Actinoplanes palleronii]